MKRDMDLIRELMLKLEELPVGPGDNVHIQPDNGSLLVEGSSVVPVGEYSADEIEYHLSLIEKARFIEPTRHGPAVGIMFKGLSWSGHDFLDSVRSPDVWDRTKQAVSTAGGFTVDLLVFAAKTYLENRIKGLVGG
jgi:hypothetical protein